MNWKPWKPPVKHDHYKLSIEDTKVVEGHTAIFKVKLDEVAKHDIKVFYETKDGTAKDGKDYTGEKHYIIIEEGEKYGTINIHTKDDHKIEDKEFFKVKIWEYDHKVKVVDDVAKGWIKDNDKKHDDDHGHGHKHEPKVSVGDVYKDEGDTGYTTFKFKVNVDGHHHGLKVKYHTEAGTANDWGANQNDYVPTSGYVEVEKGKNYGYIEVKVKGDTDVEKDEWFHVVLDDTKHYKIGDGYGKGIIENDDSGVVVPTFVPDMLIA
jgi:hypothetical protein